MSESPLVTFRCYGPASDELGKRTNGQAIGSIARRDLERYYALLKAELATVDLTEAEASLIVDARNGILHEPWSMQLFWAGISDAIELEGLDRKWHVDGPALIAKLRGLSYAQTVAIVDAAEQVWNQISKNEKRDLRDIVKTVGLTR